MRYETFSNDALDMQTICGMQRTIRTDGHTDKFEIEPTSVGFAHACPIITCTNWAHM